MYCTNSNFLNVILLIKTILNIITIVIPIILIILISIDIAKIVINPDTKTTTNVTKLIAGRAAGAILILFMPAVINLISLNVGEKDLSGNNCWTNSEVSKIELYKAREIEQKEEEEAVKAAEKEELQLELQQQAAAREQKREIAAKKQAEIEKEAAKTGFDGVVQYYQFNYPKERYGSYGTITTHGCGPTSNSIVLSSYLGVSGNDPVTVTNDLCKRGGCTSSGSIFGVMAQQLRDLGQGKLIVSNRIDHHSSMNSNLMNHLSQPNNMAIVILVGNRGAYCVANFTRGGHYIVLTGISSNGEVRMADPASTRNSSRTLPIEKITQCTNGYITISGGIR